MMTAKEKRNRAKARKVKAFLDEQYGQLNTFLTYDQGQPWQLLICVMLSAQTTDKAVNKVTPILFAKYPTLARLTQAEPLEVETIIKPIGLAPTKAKNIVKTANILADTYGGKLPKERDLLMTLPGVGYKTAGVVLGELYDYPYIPVDTHVAMVAKKLGFATAKATPQAIEETLEKAFKGLGNAMNTHRQLIMFGRQVCRPSKRPQECWAVIESREKPKADKPHQ